MRKRELLGAKDEVRLGRLEAVQPLSSLRVQAVIPRWAAEEEAISQRYGLKTMLVAICGALAVAIVVLAGLAQHRKYRFLELKSDFVATVSHELRTPLASIRLLAETLELRAGGSPEVRDYPARILQATDGLHFLVENILSFNRIDKGRWVPHFSQVKLEELIGTLRADLASATRALVQLDADVGDVELQADPSLLRLLLSNLARNACAYNHRSPVEISVRVHAPPGAGCTVLFADNGIGIPESEWEHVFQDFYRLTHPRRTDPRRRLQPPGHHLRAVLPRAAPMTTQSPPASTRPSILIVEDDANLRIGLRDNLLDEGYDVAAASNAREAETLLHGRSFDLLLLDVMLPGEDGYSLCRRLRAGGLRSMVMMLTARTLEDDIVRGFEAGAQDYLTKPYRLRELLARVKALVRRAGTPPPQVMTFAGFSLDLGRRLLSRPDGSPIELTRTEFDLLTYLVRHRDRALTRQEILDTVWGQDVVVDPRTVDNFVSNLKKKLGWTSTSGFTIHTIRGVGYRMEIDAMTKP
jgi:DNA-binding response OmpR family regulator